MLFTISTGIAFVPIFMEKSISSAFSVVMLFPFTLQMMPFPISKVIVMSLPLILSKISPGTTVEPFMSTLMILPSSAFSSSVRITFQPFLPSSSLIKGIPVSTFVSSVFPLFGWLLLLSGFLSPGWLLSVCDGGSFPTVSVFVLPQTVQVNIFSPSLSVVGCTVTVPLSHVWAAMLFFSPQVHSCQWLLLSDFQFVP